jgi:GntR family transcriptional regulator
MGASRLLPGPSSRWRPPRAGYVYSIRLFNLRMANTLSKPVVSKPGGRTPRGRPAAVSGSVRIKGRAPSVPASPVAGLAPDPDDATPLYLQLVRTLTDAIESGRWQPGEALPAERLLCTQLSVSRVTLRLAIDALVEHGLVVRRPGAGTFVRQPDAHSLSGLGGFTEAMRSKSFEPQSQWIERTLRAAYGEEILRLGLSPDSVVASLTRLRYADGRVVAYEQSVVPKRLLPKPKEIEDSLYAYLDRHGEPVVRALQHLRAVNLSARLAQHFDMKEGAAMLRVMRVGYARDGSAIELTETYCHSDYYDFVTEVLC